MSLKTHMDKITMIQGKHNYTNKDTQAIMHYEKIALAAPVVIET
jgi:hypothetical protein